MAETLLQKAQRLGIQPAGKPRTLDPQAGVISRTLTDIPRDIQEGFRGSVEAVSGGMEKASEIRQRVEEGTQTPLSGTIQTIGSGLRAGADVVGQAFLTIAKAFLPQSAEEKVSKGVESVAGGIVQSDAAQVLVEKYNTLSPEQKGIVDGLLGTAEGLGTVFGLKPAISAVKEGIKPLVREGTKLAVRAGEGVLEAGGVAGRFVVAKVGDATSLFKRNPVSIEDAVKQADEALKVQNISQKVDVRVSVPKTKIDLDSVNKRLDTLIEQGKTSEARALAEATGAKLTMSEKLINLRPDIKQRIQGKPGLMREYIDVVNTRNINDIAPSVYEYGGNYARQAAEKMEELLKESGSKIGDTRKKLGTIQAPIDEVAKIENSFLGQLTRLNLRVKNGVVEQIPGTISRLGGTSDLKIINELFADLLMVKQSPTLTNLIDLRSGFDSRINFAKQAREVSNSVDPLSRQVRKDIADTAAKVVGKSEAGELKRFSEFMDAFNDIRSYTDRKAGGEYLLRLVLSGRGGEARQIIATIKEHTGIDLLDHATMMQVTNEMLGNAAQKNLFRQEATKAGLDVARLLGGDPSGAFATLFDKSVDRILNPEKILMKAAK